jgi:hypothetical protein
MVGLAAPGTMVGTGTLQFAGKAVRAIVLFLMTVGDPTVYAALVALSVMV